MKKTLALSIAVLLLPVIARAQRVDTTKVKPGTYVPELGYFQKAYRDDSDLRFMITDKDGRFSLGVGGTVHMGTFYDFDGAMEGNAFSPGEIAIPMDRTGHFDYFSPYCFLGVEYLYGQKLIYGTAGVPGADRGHANRLNACLCYKF